MQQECGQTLQSVFGASTISLFPTGTAIHHRHLSNSSKQLAFCLVDSMMNWVPRKFNQPGLGCKASGILKDITVDPAVRLTRLVTWREASARDVPVPSVQPSPVPRPAT